MADRVRAKAVVAYDGAAFHGFAATPGVETVAGVLREALERVLSHARLGLEQRLAEGRTVARHLIDGIGLASAEVAVSRGEAGWGRWTLSIYASLGLQPSLATARSVAGRIESVPSTAAERGKSIDGTTAASDAPS